MSVSDLSSSAQDYLKAVWALSEWSDAPVTPKLLSERLGLRVSSVSDAVRKLTEQGLLDHSPYGAIELTAEGRSYALAMVRRHRLIEAFLVEVLGYSWNEVHDEAESLEHAVSDMMVDRIDSLLGFPTRDPHGDAIPSVDGRVLRRDASQLSDVPSGSTVVVERVSDEDPDLLRFFEESGVVHGAVLHVRQGPPFSGVVEILVDGDEADRISLGHPASSSVYVSIADQ